MATAAEGGGGAGGKFRKRPFRRQQTTPYDRPATALRASVANPSTAANGWLSKLVDPASKLITYGAHRLFASVFRRRLPSLPPPPLAQEANQELRDTLQDVVPASSPGAQEPAIIEGGSTSNCSDGSNFADVEKILKQNSFTRSQIDRLTELLRTRSADFPVVDGERRSEINFSKAVAAKEKQEKFASDSVQENGIETNTLFGVISTPVVSSRVFEEDVASPAELAKAYMGSRPSKVSPSTLGLRSQALREDTVLPTNPAFTPKAPVRPLVPMSTIHAGVTDNGFRTLRSRGRSAIYSMARTPYSRVHPTAAYKAAGSSTDGYRGSSTFQGAWEPNGFSGSKQVALKRRSSALDDDDVGSVGPIRRIRQKPNLLSPKSLSLSVSVTPLAIREAGAGSDAAQIPMSLTQKAHSVDESKHKFSKPLAEDMNNSSSRTGFSSVPSQSSETAAKILQHLDKLVTPKEKSPEVKLTTARDKSPTKLTTNMLHGRALRSLEDVNTSKYMQPEQDNKRDGFPNTSIPDIRDSTSHKQDKVEENGSKMSVFPGERLTPVVHSSDSKVSSEDPVAVKIADYAISHVGVQSSQKKRAFQMSAHEDFLDLDDDSYGNYAAPVPLAESGKKFDTYAVDSEANAPEAVEVQKTPAFSEIKPTTSSALNKKSEIGISNGSMTTDKNSIFTFSNSDAPRTTAPSTMLASQTTVTFDHAPPKESSVSSLFNFGSKNADKVPAFTFSSSSFVASESPGSKSSASLNAKPEISSGFPSGATEAVLKMPESDKGDDKNALKDEGISRKPDFSPSAASVSTPSLPAISTATPFSPAMSSSTSSTSIFSFGLTPNTSNLTNGSISSSPSIISFPTPALGSTSFTNQIFSSSSTSATTASTPAIASSSSSLSTSAAAPLPSASIFKFGSSLAQSSPVSSVPATSVVETEGSEARKKQEAPLGSTPFGGAFTSASTGSGIFGFSVSPPSLAVNSQSQGSSFGIGSAQASSSSTGIAAFSQSMPIQFSSSVSSPIFGSTGPTSLTSGSSLFGSTSANNIFSSSTSFGSSSLAAASEANSIGSSSGATTATFGSSLPPKLPGFGSVAGFPFASSSFPASNSASTMFESSSSPFSFSSAVTAAPSSLSLPPPTVFGNPSPSFGFSLASPGNNDQMNMEDSMAEDNVQASALTVSPFSQVVGSPPSSFGFGSTASSGAFQFGLQQNQVTPSPHQASGSLDFAAGGSFSLGSGGTEKSSRKMVRVKHKQRRK